MNARVALLSIGCALLVSPLFAQNLIYGPAYDPFPEVVVQRPVISSPSVVVSHPVVGTPAPTTVYSAPTTVYSAPLAAPIVSSPVVVQRPVTTYSPIVTSSPTVVYSPVTSAPVATPVVSYSPVMGYSPMISYSPVVASPVYGMAASPVVVRSKVYVPGQPVRNFLRAITP